MRTERHVGVFWVVKLRLIRVIVPSGYRPVERVELLVMRRLYGKTVAAYYLNAHCDCLTARARAVVGWLLRGPVGNGWPRGGIPVEDAGREKGLAGLQHRGLLYRPPLRVCRAMHGWRPVLGHGRHLRALSCHWRRRRRYVRLRRRRRLFPLPLLQLNTIISIKFSLSQTPLFSHLLQRREPLGLDRRQLLARERSRHFSTMQTANHSRMRYRTPVLIIKPVVIKTGFPPR